MLITMSKLRIATFNVENLEETATLHEESPAFADDPKFPDSDHAPVVATFDLG
jgi:hypothetical protein